MKVAVLMGGRSAEREISLKTGQGVAHALRALGHDVTSVDAADGALLPADGEEAGARGAAAVGLLPLRAQVGLVDVPAVREADIVYIALHGTFGEDGRIQALLELAGLRYTGSGVLASALAMDKVMSKRMFVHDGVPTPRWSVRCAGERPDARDLEACGGLPVVVKPSEEGSSVALSIVTRAADLEPAFLEAALHGDVVLIEEYIPGRELTVTVLGGPAHRGDLSQGRLLRLREQVHEGTHGLLLPGGPAGAARGAHPRAGVARGAGAGLHRRVAGGLPPAAAGRALVPRSEHHPGDDPDQSRADGGAGGGAVL
jgi:D-alanine--D-alanine ligase